MNNIFKTPSEISAAWVDNGAKKAHLSVLNTLLLAILAGIYISLGATGFITMSSAFGEQLSGLGKFLGAALFPVGLMLVILCGAELFTGNNLISIAFFAKKISFWRVIRNWLLVFLGNALGCYFFAFVLAESSILNDNAVNFVLSVASSKVSMTFMQALLRGFMCNLLVALACWMQTSCQDTAGKILAIFFPVLLFVVCGYEHSVANLFYIPLGQFLGSEVTVLSMWLNNILPVALGNILAGGVFVPFIYYIVYLRKGNEVIK